MRIYSGKCKCKKKLDMRITEVRENPKDNKSDIIAWLIYGFCKRCKKIYVQDIIVQEEIPILDRDFIIDYDKEVSD